MINGETGCQRGTGLIIAIMFVLIIAAAAMRVQRPVLRDDAPIDNPPWPDMYIDLNHATEAELTLLPGIGPALARSIVDDRAVYGPFDTLEDLMRVHMIGPATVDRIEPYVRPASSAEE